MTKVISANKEFHNMDDQKLNVERNKKGIIELMCLITQVNKTYYDRLKRLGNLQTWRLSDVAHGIPPPPFLKVNFDPNIRENRACLAAIRRNHKNKYYRRPKFGYKISKSCPTCYLKVN